MFKVLALVVLMTLNLGANAGFTNGKCGKATISFSGISGRVQCNKNHMASDKFNHFSYDQKTGI